MENTLTVTLSTGVKVSVPRGSYAVEIWYNGKWNVVCTFPGTDEGRDQAESVMHHLVGHAQLNQYR